MKIDDVLKNFCEKYDRECMESIDNFSNDIKVDLNGGKVNVVDITESFRLFTELVNGYSDCLVKAKDNEKLANTMDMDTRTYTENYIGTIVNRDSFNTTIKYSEIPKYIETYLSEASKLRETINTNQRNMLENEVDPIKIGEILECTDKFIGIMDDKFNSIMETFLRTSGYTTRKNLHGRKKPEETAVFL